MSQIDECRDLSFTRNRELSWLEFDRRVLEEAADPAVPLLERLRFLSIFTSNLDEFFMVRVGSLQDLAQAEPDHRENKSGLTPAEQLLHIYQAVGPLLRRRDGVWADLARALAERGIEDIPYDRLSGEDRAHVRAWYRESVRPLLTAQVIDHSHPFPHLKNKALYAAALLRGENETRLGIVGVPDGVPPILHLPGRPGAFVRTETVLLHYLKKLFHIYHVEESAVISVTRNADIPYDERFDQGDLDLRVRMTRLLRQRERLAPVRLEMQEDAPGLRQQLLRRLRLESHQCYVCACPLDLHWAYRLEGPALLYPPHVPRWPEGLEQGGSVIARVSRRDVLLFYPYHTMQPFLDLLREAASDPTVASIQITVYRLASRSAVVKHLCAAAENGKSVTVVVELRARFDEQNNVTWARELEEAGCRVIYGPEGYKCHAKLCRITRRDRRGISYITQVGTGNYNEKTAGLYTDFSLLTADGEIGADAAAFFQNMLIGDLRGQYSRLMVAPSSLKPGLLRLIDGEIARGEQGRIILKTNAITERELIDKLSEASRAGVKIDLIVRGICCLLPGIPGRTENITVTSLVGRFLEHSRIYCFGDGPMRQVYIASADIMTRNQERRVEVACPVRDPALRDFLGQYLDLLLHDNVKARRLLPDGSYAQIKLPEAPPVNAQSYYLDHPPVLAAPEPEGRRQRGEFRFWPWRGGEGRKYKFFSQKPRKN